MTTIKQVNTTTNTTTITKRSFTRYYCSCNSPTCSKCIRRRKTLQHSADKLIAQRKYKSSLKRELWKLYIRNYRAKTKVVLDKELELKESFTELDKIKYLLTNSSYRNPLLDIE